MIAGRGPLPRRRRDLVARLEALREWQREGQREEGSESAESVLPERVDSESRRSEAPKEIPTPSSRAREADENAVDPRRFSRVRAARRAARGLDTEHALETGHALEMEQGTERVERARPGAISAQRCLGEKRPRVRSPAPDPAALFVDEWIDPVTAPADHFGAKFPDRVPFDEDVLYLDLETTGLGAHELVALAGTLRPERGGVRLRQHFCFDPAQEHAVLRATLADLEGVRQIVTYNGRTFDLPFLRKRLAWHRLPPLDPDLDHLDLLTEIRRRHWKEWGDCSLGNAERQLLGKERTGPDVPGREVPLRFADVRDGAPVHLLEPVIHHNRIDLTSLVALHALRLGDPDSADLGA